MKNAINLLPKKSPEEESVKRQRRKAYVLTGGGLILLGLLWLIPLLILTNTQKTEEALLSQIKQREEALKQLSVSETLYRDMFQRASAASTLLENKDVFLQKTKNVQRLTGAGLVVKEATIDKSHVKLAVTSTTLTPILAYLNDLENGEIIEKSMTKATISSISINRTLGYEVVLEGDLLDEKQNTP